MSETSPWMTLNERYEYDSEAQFLLFVEQFAEAIDLATTGVLPKQRMSLVASDNLAELLLHRHKRRILRLSSEGGDLDIPRLDRSDLREFERDFGARVRLARRGGGAGMGGRLLAPLLDEADAAIFRVAHSYRNRVYHADRHNSAVLPLLTTAYLNAVARSFVRFQPTNVGSSMSATTRKLAAFGYAPDEDGYMRGSFRPASAAEKVVAHLGANLGVPLADSRETLTADLVARTDWADEMVADLLGQGMPRQRLEWSLAWGEFWDFAGIDPEVVRLDRELADLWNSIVRDSGKSREADFSRRNDLLEQRNARVAELAAEFTGRFSLRDVERLRRLAGRLASARSLGHLFERYRHIDDRMDRIERRLDDAAIGWDRMVEIAAEEARGK